MKTKTKTTRKRVYPILQQIVQYLPCWTLEKLANKHRIDARSFSATSHVVALMVAHLAHTSSLNETCDVCAMHEKKLRYVRNVTPPHRNTLSNANRTRPAAIQFADFIGYNENAVKWQVWIGLLVHMLLHYAKFLSAWTQSFARLVGIVRGGMWLEIDLVETLILYGTAGPEKKPKLCLEQACFKGFEDPAEKNYGTEEASKTKETRRWERQTLNFKHT